MSLQHALLSASSAHRWISCPPSALLSKNFEDVSSTFAQEGTDAHTLAQYKLENSLGIKTKDPTESLSFYNEEMNSLRKQEKPVLILRYLLSRNSTSRNMSQKAMAMLTV